MMQSSNRRLFIVFIFCLVIIHDTSAQLNKASTNFISTQLTDYKNWLTHTNLNTILTVDTAILLKEKYVLQMRIKDAYNWQRLVWLSDSAFQNSLSDVLLKRFAFQMDLKQTNCEITIDAVDAGIGISWEKGKAVTKVWKKMGIISDGVALSLTRITNLNALGPLNTKRSIEDIKRRLQAGLKQYLKQYQAKIEKFRFEVIYQLDNSLILEISNIVDAVLDEGYFEHIRLDFSFQQENNNVKLVYDIKGKYGAGLIWAPQSSRYRDMIPKYDAAVQRFSLKMSNKIGELLK